MSSRAYHIIYGVVRIFFRICKKELERLLLGVQSLTFETSQTRGYTRLFQSGFVRIVNAFESKAIGSFDLLLIIFFCL